MIYHFENTESWEDKAIKVER